MQVEKKGMLIARLRDHIMNMINQYEEYPDTYIAKIPMREQVVDFVACGNISKTTRVYWPAHPCGLLKYLLNV